MRGGLLGEVAAGEHHSRDMLVEQHADVVGFRQAAGRPGAAQHGGKASLRKRAADDLGQGREDRVLQFGQHQADQPDGFTDEPDPRTVAR